MDKQTQDDEVRDLLEKRAELIHDAYRPDGEEKDGNAEELHEKFDELRAQEETGGGCTLVWILLAIIVIAIFAGMSLLTTGKPVIYLYPEERTDVTVKLEYNGKLTYTYPQYADGWSVTASPDGTLIDRADGREYSYLFWEGDTWMDFDFSKGFVVKGSDTATFLQEKLAHLGLTPREYNEFIVYWLPQMQDNPYNLIAFQGAAYTDNAKLTITPEPDSVLRVFMAFKPLKFPVDVPPQELQPFERKGFVVVEWGATRVP